jgi:hypothetical protein
VYGHHWNENQEWRVAEEELMRIESEQLNRSEEA